MKKTGTFKKLLSVLLTAAMLLGAAQAIIAAAPAGASASGSYEELSFREIENGNAASKLRDGSKGTVQKEAHAFSDIVRVSIYLDREPTLKAGFDAKDVRESAAASAYRDSLRAYQDVMTGKINAAIGSKIDVRWNITLGADIISANVMYGLIDKIKAVEGVSAVVLEREYKPAETVDGAEPMTASSTVQTGASYVWNSGYTGAGSRVAILDNGFDVDHISLSNEAYLYSLGLIAEEKGMSADEYIASLNLLGIDEIAAKADKLNVDIVPEDAYENDKIPFAYNYGIGGYDVSSVSNKQSDHGSHVAGIAAANAYLEADGGFEKALDTVFVQGVAPDAQLILMNVFSMGGGTYDSDYFAALEDALVLGCDVANLSLGSSDEGFAFESHVDDFFSTVTESGMIVAAAAGNSGVWYRTAANDDALPGYTRIGDATYATTGSPSTYNNALSVANVSNSGGVGKTITFGDLDVFYSEPTDYSNEPLSTLVNDEGYEYVFIDGVGTEEDFAALADVLPGKIAICSRGEITFVEKATNAVAYGAVATIIYNNVPGSLGMLLADYQETNPVVIISQVDGAAIRDRSEEVVLDDGTVYFTGKLTISEDVKVVYGDDTDVQLMVDSSSWGPTSSLVLKPEITAPGGSIYSLNAPHVNDDGSVSGDHDSYGTKTGTSMASPQIAGMAALVTQYIRENGLCEKTGFSQRQLTNSLLMSTAHPIFEQYEEDLFYYPVIEVGAGLANVNDAVNATSFIMMDEDSTISPETALDGKVKAELGDDPDRTGMFAYKFTVYPLGESKTFTLGTDIFTQDIFAEGYDIFLDTWTIDLPADVSYMVNGEVIDNYSPIDADVNLDGEVNAADAQAILDCVSGALGEDDPFDPDAADINWDGEITSYDAHLLLASFRTEQITITEPTEVFVCIFLDDDTLEYLDNFYEGGAYIEGYTYLYPDTTEDGAFTDSVHSIPILGYYGSWTDASMFDRTSLIEAKYAEEDPIPYFDTYVTNYLSLSYPDGVYSFVGNPYIIEDTFPADRLAISSLDGFDSFTCTPIRNVGTLGAAVTNETGKVIWAKVIRSYLSAPFYDDEDDKWYNTDPKTYKVGVDFSDLDLVEGDRITIGAYALPEYYTAEYLRRNELPLQSGELDDEGFTSVLRSNTVGDGAAIKYTFTVDNTAPQIESIFRDLETGDILVKASDNNYIAAEFVYSPDFTPLASGIPEQSEAGQTSTLLLDLGGQMLPRAIVIVVCDYAGNETYYEVDLNQEVDLSGSFYGFIPDGGATYALTIDLDTLHFDAEGSSGEGGNVLATFNGEVTAAEYVDGYVFLAFDDGKLAVADVLSLYDNTYIADFGEVTSVIYDMAFDYGTNTLYALGLNNILYSVDLISGVLTPEYQIPVQGVVNAIAIDDSEFLYFTTQGRPDSAKIFRLCLVEPDLNPIGEGTLLGLYNMSRGGGLAYDHDNDVLYFASNWSNVWDEDHFIVTIDTETGEVAPVNDNYGADSGRIGDSLRGMFIIPSDNRIISRTDVATSIENLGRETYDLLKGQVKKLDVYARPWTLTNRDLIYVSSDESVVTVNGNGYLIAGRTGEAVVTITTAAEPHLEAKIYVTVEPAPSKNLTGLIYDKDGVTAWCEFNTNHPEDWEVVNPAGRYNAAGITGDTIYAVDSMSVYAVDAETFEVASLGSIVPDHLFTDAAPIPDGFVFSGAEPTLATVCGEGFGIGTIEPDSGYYHYEDVSDFIGDDPMVAIAFITGEIDFEGDGVGDPFYYVMTESGAVYGVILLSYLDYAYAEYLGDTGITLEDVSVSDNSRASLYYDEETDFLYLAKYIYPNDTAYLYAIDSNDFERNTELGSFGADVWPVIGLYTYEPGTELSLSVRPTAISIYEGESSQIYITVKHGETNGFTVVSSDPDVVSVDENGLVTALGVGEATITVTTKDVNALGEPLVKEVRVNVIETVSLDTSVVCQISDESGDHFAKLDLNDLSYEAIADAPGRVTAGARSGNVYFAGMNEDIRTLDAETFGDTDWDCYSNYFATYVPQDVANYPTFTVEGETTDSKFLFTTEYGYLLDTEFMGWNLGSGLAALELVGYGDGTDSEYGPYYDYLLLTTDGFLYDLPVYYTVGRLDIFSMLDTGLRLSDESDVSMAYVLDYDDVGEVKYEGVILAIESAKQVWFIDFLDGYKVKLVGNFDVDHIDGLVGYLDQIGTEEELIEAFTFGSAPARSLGKLTKAKATSIEAEQFAFEDVARIAETDNFLPDPALTGPGSSERASAHYMPVLRGAVGTAGDGEVSIALTEVTDTSNGVIRVEYDPEAMEYVGADSEVALISVNVSDGVITFAYASDADITAGEVIGNLYFSYTGGYVDTEVTVYTEELGPDSDLEGEGETVTILKEDGDHELEEISRFEATCTEDGLITSRCTKCGGIIEEVIPALGHTIEDIAEVPATCTQPGTTAGKKCAVCGKVFEGLEVIFPTGHNAVIDNAVEPTCEGVGYTVGTHCANCGEILIAQDEIPAKGHVWDDGTVTVQPTYEAEGVKTFTCSVCGGTKTEAIPKLEHTTLPCKDEESCPGKVFTDMPKRGSWSHDPIDWAVEYGITQGTSKTTFGPNNLVSRAQVVTFLWRAAGCPEPQSSSISFTDVKPTAYYYKPVMWALEKEITKGATSTAFDPDGICTRGQIVTFLYRYAGSPAVNASSSKFNDVIKGAFYESAVAWAVAEDITSGVSATKFAPNDVCTRAQTVTFLYRLANK